MIPEPLSELELLRRRIAELEQMKALARNENETRQGTLFGTGSDSGFRGENQLRLITDSLPVLISYVDSEERYRFNNKTYEEWFGRSRKELYGKNVREVIGEEAYELIKPRLQAVLRGETQVFERLLPYRNLTPRYVTVTYVPDISEGQVRGYFALIEDISSRREAEIALRAREEEARTLLSSLPDVVSRFDRNLRFLYTSPAVQRETGLPPEHFIGKTHAGAGLPPELSEKLEAKLLEIFETGQTLNVEFELTTAEHGVRSYFGIGVPEFGADGCVTTVLTIVRDITGRKQAEEKLKASEELFRRIVETAAEGIWIVDAETRTTFANQRMAEMLGYTPSELIGRSCFEFIHPDDLDRGKEGFEKRKQGDTTSREYRAYRREGTLVWLNFTASPMKDDKGCLTGVLAMCTDISERKRGQEALEKSNAALRRMNEDLRQFAYAASHDLREPLRMVSIYSQLLSKRYKGKLDDDADTFLGYTEQGARRMQVLLDDLLAFSQAGDTGGKPAEAVDCGTAVHIALQNLKRAIEENRAEITSDPLPTVPAHASHLVQVFQNLVANALKYRSEETPRIHISAESRERDWLFHVRDNGIGINPKYHKLIFGLFKRLHHPDDHPGTGIGLSICARVVERYGGSIWVESEPAKGSTFCFTIPKRDE